MYTCGKTSLGAVSGIHIWGDENTPLIPLHQQLLDLLLVRPPFHGLMISLNLRRLGGAGAGASVVPSSKVTRVGSGMVDGAIG